MINNSLPVDLTWEEIPQEVKDEITQRGFPFTRFTIGSDVDEASLHKLVWIQKHGFGESVIAHPATLIPHGPVPGEHITRYTFEMAENVGVTNVTAHAGFIPAESVKAEDFPPFMSARS